MIVNAAARLPTWRSGLVTVTVRVPTAAWLAMVMLTARWVAFVKTTELTVMSKPKETVGVATKSTPTTVTASVAPCPPVLAETEETVGGGSSTVNPATRVPAWVSGLVTVMVRTPGVAAPDIVILTVSWIDEFHVTLLTVTPAPNDTVGVATKNVPPTNTVV